MQQDQRANTTIVIHSVRRKLFRAIAALLGLAFLTQSMSIGLPAEGRVVDATTGAPISGVQVLAAWKLDALSFAGASPGGVVRLHESVTNAEGVYRLPAWLEIHRPLVPFSGFARKHSDFPRLLFFKGKYYPQQVRSDTPGPTGNVIALQKAPMPAGDAAFAEYRRRFESFAYDVETVSRGQHGVGCTWSERAGMLRALESEAQRIGLDSVIEDNRVPIERCGELKAFP